MAGIVVVDPRSKTLPPLSNLMSVASCSRELALTGESTIAYAAMSLSTAACPITVTWHTPGGLPHTDCDEVICQPCPAEARTSISRAFVTQSAISRVTGEID